MSKYRKRPVEVDAMLFSEATSADVCAAWCGGRVAWVNDEGHFVCAVGQPNAVTIDTLEGTMTAREGDWIIRGVKGEFYPCKPDVFEATYEPVAALGGEDG